MGSAGQVLLFGAVARSARSPCWSGLGHLDSDTGRLGAPGPAGRRGPSRPRSRSRLRAAAQRAPARGGAGGRTSPREHRALESWQRGLGATDLLVEEGPEVAARGSRRRRPTPRKGGGCSRQTQPGEKRREGKPGREGPRGRRRISGVGRPGPEVRRQHPEPRESAGRRWRSARRGKAPKGETARRGRARSAAGVEEGG